MAASEQHSLRIGELSRRVGVSTELLRAWERRYRLLAPQRTAGGFRLYSEADERRVRLMQSHLERGLSAAEAARLALAEETGDDVGWEHDARMLSSALDGFREDLAHVAFDRLLAALTTDTLLSSVLIPYLHELGERWAHGEITVGQEHFATHVVRGRLLGLARGWGRGAGPRAVLACPPGELHDLALLAFGISLRARGWTITYLGPDTPPAEVAEAAERTGARLVMLSAVDPARFAAVADELAALAAARRLVLAGAGASLAFAGRIGAVARQDGPVEAAEALAEIT